MVGKLSKTDYLEGEPEIPRILEMFRDNKTTKNPRRAAASKKAK
jgi:hypothetical protein